MNRESWTKTDLGQVLFESRDRLGTEPAERVYGVGRSAGLTEEAKYQSKNLSRYKKIQPGMFAYNPMRLNIGSIGFCNQGRQPGVVSSDYVVFGCKPGLLPEYLDYMTRGSEWEAWASAGGVGSVRLRIYYKELATWELTIPDLDYQRSVVDLLQSLDSKIELNRRMNETLEGIARAIFKSWFVDFDPVRAKMEGRKPVGMSPRTANLFPDAFTDSELGRIPQGWKYVKIADVVELSRKSLDPRDEPLKLFEHFSIPAFDEGKRPRLETGADIRSNKLQVTPACILVSRLNPRIKRVWLPDATNWERAICSTEFAVAQARPSISRSWLYCLFESEEFQGTLGTLVTGTSGSHQRVQPEALLTIPAVVPTNSIIIKMFANLVDPTLQKIAGNLKESAILGDLRDALLPKLISGEIRLHDLEKTVEAAS